MNETGKEELIRRDMASLEKHIRHVFNQGYELGFREGKKIVMRWQKHTDASGNSWHTCSACGHIAYTLTRFCPDCGKRLEAPS